MGIEMGRISGGALADNLLRNGTDLAFETQLLYFDVTNQRIGINTNGPVADLNAPNTIQSVNFITTSTSTFPNYTISGNTIQNTIGTIYLQPNQASNPQILTTNLETANLSISNQLIKNYVTNDNINLSPVTGGQVVFTTTQVNIQGNGTDPGNLHATGNITWDGNITLGNAPTDTVNFTAEINSNILPNSNNADNLGSGSLNWNNLYSVNVKATNNINTSNITVNGINLFFTPSNTIYVSVNGIDTNIGTHLHSTYRTIAKALSVATSGTEIVIFPGTYTEVFPLTIPQGVSLKGTGIRATIIQPTVGTQSNDAFLLNGDTTVEFLTVQNFYYNSTADTGYAFRFANGFHTNFRSPYIQNITVLTKGSVTSGSDPRGFNQGDAGRGLLIDGSVASSSSSQIPTLLCFSVTLITPGAEAIIATNGVRLEWLNGFSYFASKGLHLINGTAGRYNQGTVFGAEVRVINSANIYGTYGVIADGANTLAYLIGHNFAYIGTNADFLNDPSKAIQANEVIQLNGGVVYWESTDQSGNFRVGQIFEVNESTGQVTFNAQSINITAGGYITLIGPTSTTTINTNEIATGNLVISGNTISSTNGDVDFLASSTTTTLNSNTTVNGLFFTVTGNANLTGSVVLGASSSNSISFNATIPQTVSPGTTSTYTLGSSSKRWETLYNDLLDNGSIQISNNTITTLTTNTDLKLQANGTGKVHIYQNVQASQNLTVNNNLTINGSSTLKNTSVKAVTQTGDFNQTGASNAYITGLFANNNIQITGASSYLQVPNFKLQYNNISITSANTDLQLIPLAGNGGTPAVNIEYLKFYNNSITNIGPSGHKDIVLTPTGTGNVRINSVRSLELPNGNDSNLVLSTNGQIRYNTTNNNIEGYASTGYVNFFNLYSQNYQTYITPELTPGTADNTIRFATNGTVRANLTSSAFTATTWNIGNIALSGNTINPLGSNNLYISPVSVTTPYSGSAQFNGGNYLSITSGTSALSLGTGSYTAECWVYYTSIPTAGECIFGIWDDTYGLEYMLYAFSSTELAWVTRNSAGSSNNPIFFTSPSANGWHHIAAVRSVNAIEVYVDGAMVGTATYNGTQNVGTGAPFSVGSRDAGSGVTHFVGYVSNLRITPGTAIYQSAFTPPSAPLSAVSGTALMMDMSTSVLLLVDSSSNNFTITNNGTVTWSSYTPYPYSTITTGGNTLINNVGFIENYITNPNNTAFTLQTNGNGYVKFAGTGAVVLAYGNTASRNPTPENGMTRYNSELNYMEVYTTASNTWIPAVGTSGAASESEIEDLAFTYSLIFGGHGG
jgi:hypothetical protein